MKLGNLAGTEISALYAAGGAGKCKLDSDNDGLTVTDFFAVVLFTKLAS